MRLLPPRVNPIRKNSGVNLPSFALPAESEQAIANWKAYRQDPTRVPRFEYEGSAHYQVNDTRVEYGLDRVLGIPYKLNGVRTSAVEAASAKMAVEVLRLARAHPGWDLLPLIYRSWYDPSSKPKAGWYVVSPEGKYTGADSTDHDYEYLVFQLKAAAEKASNAQAFKARVEKVRKRLSPSGRYTLTALAERIDEYTRGRDQNVLRTAAYRIMENGQDTGYVFVRVDQEYDGIGHREYVVLADAQGSGISRREVDNYFVRSALTSRSGQSGPARAVSYLTALLSEIQSSAKFSSRFGPILDFALGKRNAIVEDDIYRDR